MRIGAPGLDAAASYTIVIPAKAGTRWSASRASERWIPAFAGMTPKEAAAGASTGGCRREPPRRAWRGSPLSATVGQAQSAFACPKEMRKLPNEAFFDHRDRPRVALGRRPPPPD